MRFTSTIFVITALCFFSFAALEVQAEESSPIWETSFMSGNPADVLKQAEQHSDEEADIISLFEENVYSFDDQGKQLQTERMVYRILNENGMEDWSVVEFEWSEWHEDRPEIRARVISTDGRVHELDPATINDAQADDSTDLYSDRRVVQAPLPGVGIGAVVEYEIISRENKPFFDAGTSLDYFVGRTGVPSRHERVIFEYPSNFPFNFYLNKLEGTEPKKKNENGRTSLTFDFGPRPAMKSPEAGQRPDLPAWPSISFSTGTSWQNVASSYNNIVERQIEAADLNRFNLESKESDTRSKLDEFLSSLKKEIRYTGIEFGESSIVPVRPNEALKRKYGDCKDQAALLIAMLRKAGISSHMALLRTGPGRDIRPELPGLGSFTHAIVYVPGETAVWIDPTDEFAKAGQLPAGDQGRYALIIDSTTKDLIRTPESTYEDNRIVEHRDFFLSEDGPAKVIETTEYYGTFDSDYRYRYKGVDQKTQKKWFDDYTKNSYLSKGKISWKISQVQDLSAPFKIQIEMEKATRGFTSDTQSVVAIFPSNFLNYFPSAIFKEDQKEEDSQNENETDQASKKRKTNFYFSNPFTASWLYKISVPPGFRPMNLPESKTQEISGVRFIRKFSTNSPEEVTAEFHVETSKRVLSADEFESLKKEVDAIDKEETILIRFEQIGMSLLESGKIVEALKEIKKLRDLHPAEALHRAQFSEVLLQGGMGEEARKEAHKAIELEPKSALAYRNLGHVLEFDLIGRQFGKGFDYDGALAAYTKAKELDPKDAVTRASLGIFLERNKEGIHYGKGTNLAAAITEFEYLENELKVKTYQQNALIALLYSEKFEEAEKKCREMKNNTNRNAVLVIATAVLKGPDKALELAASLEEDPDARTKLLDTAGSTLVQIRHYPEAAVLIESTVSGAANPMFQKARVDMIKKMKRYEELNLAPDDPQSPVKKLFISMLKTNSTKNDVIPLFAKRLQAKITKEDDFQESFRSGMQMMLGNKAAELQNDFFIDTCFALMNIFTEGDQQTGYRVLLQGNAMGRSFSTKFFEIFEEGGYKIVGNEYMLYTLGEEALLRWKSGDINGAKQWLNWSREEAALPSSDDPASGNSIHRLWKKGEENESSIPAAAASLMTFDPEPNEAVKVLIEERKKNDDEQWTDAIDLALLPSYFKLKKDSEVIEISNRLLKKFPMSNFLLHHLTWSMLRTSQYQEVENANKERLKSDPGNISAMRNLTLALEYSGKLDEARAMYKKMFESGKAIHEDYNRYAWDSLFRDKISDEDFEASKRAVDLAGVAGSSSLHTLASLYAEEGQVADALQAIRKSIELSGKQEPRSYDWYVFGRIAEYYDLPEVSKQFYSRVKKPDSTLTESMSAYSLAVKRLAVLQKQNPK